MTALDLAAEVQKQKFREVFHDTGNAQALAFLGYNAAYLLVGFLCE
jgi:hypothetical protein